MNFYNIALATKQKPFNIFFKFILFIWLCSTPFKNVVYQISTIFLLLICVFHFIYYKNYHILISNFKKLKILSMFVLFIIITMLISNLLHPELIDKKSYHLIIMFIIRYWMVFIALAYFYTINFFTKKELLIFLFIGSFLVITTVLYQLYLDKGIQVTGLEGTLGNRNIFGLMMGIASVFSLLLIKANNKKPIILFIIFSTFMIFSLSRSNWVAVSAALVLFIMFNFKSLNLTFYAAIISFILILLISYFNFEFIQLRVKLLLEGYSSHRYELWGYGFDQIKNHPFFGHGVNIWRSLEMPEHIAAHSGVHNSIIEIMLFTGFFGLVAWITTTLKVAFDIIKSKNFNYFCLLSYFVIVTQFDFSVFDSKELFSYISVFLFLVYSDKFKVKSC
ncbi:putative membrane protein, putative O-glycosylation ligase [Campylobacter iguaniorum]|uniref:O-antigen ligase family protein n=1 Tax=Campylobacter iguaniorum TaxID=1244531 RepID=UPI00073A3F2B|nr:O-antigen ligase family protein [Campylobacter iguaniorum]ALV25155.1 putative membrane protein, putative O-glycosylation ligase [Campylobacter iguaniorum]